MARDYTKVMVLFCAVLLLTGCTFFKLKEEIQLMQTNVAIGGEIKNRSTMQKPLIIILYSEGEGEKQIKNIQVLEPTDQYYFFIVTLGDYYVAAFEDANANFSLRLIAAR